MKATWYVIANSAEARIYERNAISGELQLVESLSHPESRMKGNELSSDRPGHNQSSGNGHGSFVERTGPKEYESERFAIEISQFLDSQRNQNKFGALCIAASPHFHGLLNKRMNKNLTTMVNKHIEKDLTQVKETQLGDVLQIS